MRTKKFILKAITTSKEIKIDQWNPYYRIGTVFSDKQLSVMSKTELNNLLKVAIECLDATESYMNMIESKINK